MSSSVRRLYRSTTDRKVWGVCGGLGQYFGIDPVLIRVVFVVLAFAGGLGIFLYLVLALVTPAGTPPPQPASSSGGSGGASGQPGGQATSGPAGGSAATLLGIALVIVGAMVLLANLNLFWWFKFSIIGPLVLIILGLLLFFGRGRGQA